MVTRADRRNTSAREHSLHPLRVDPTEDGVVNVDGPDAVDVALTPDAALETSDRLLKGAMNARGQKYFADRGRGGSPSDR